MEYGKATKGRAQQLGRLIFGQRDSAASLKAVSYTSMVISFLPSDSPAYLSSYGRDSKAHQPHASSYSRIPDGLPLWQSYGQAQSSLQPILEIRKDVNSRPPTDLPAPSRGGFLFPGGSHTRLHRRSLSATYLHSVACRNLRRPRPFANIKVGLQTRGRCL